MEGMHQDLIRNWKPQRYFNPRHIVQLEAKASGLEQLAEEGQSLHIQNELRNARNDANSLANAYFHSHLKGFAIAGLGILGFALNQMPIEEIKQLQSASAEILNNANIRGYLTWASSLVFGAGTAHFVSRSSLYSAASAALRKIQEINIKLGYKEDPLDNLDKKDPSRIYLRSLENQVRKALDLIPAHRSFPDYVEFRERSVDRQGKGLFAKRDIKEGELVGKLGGVLVHSPQVPKYLEEVGNYGVRVHDELYVSPASREEVKNRGAINHSCKPNVGMHDSLSFVAMNDIKKGEELLVDYAMTGLMQGFECACASDCRTQVTLDDWKKPELQRKYQGYFSPYIAKQISGNSVQDELALILDTISWQLEIFTDMPKFKERFFVPRK